MSEISSTEPARITAGDTLTWQKALPDYPASAGWVLSYALLGPGGKFTFAATASGDDHLVSVSAPTSAAWPAGPYNWQAYVTKGAERVTVGMGQFTVLANFATATDGKSTARKILEAIEAVLQGSATFAQRATMIGDKRLERHSVAELLEARSRLQNEVAGEDAAARVAAGLASGHRVLVRFAG